MREPGDESEQEEIEIWEDVYDEPPDFDAYEEPAQYQQEAA